MLSKAKLAIPLALLISIPAHAETTDFSQLLQNVIDHYPAIKTAYYQVAKAQQESIKVNGQLGWQLGAQTGFAKEVSLFGSPVDQITLGGSLGRKLESGDSISFSASLAYEDSETPFAGLPNPATSSDLRFEYTKPLAKGSENIDYTLGLNNAKAGVDIKIAEQRNILDKMAEQVIELYLSIVNTKQRIDNTQSSIKRTKKLSKFISDRLKLGIVEDKDQLQTNAQLQSQEAQLSALKLAWTQQVIAINRLTGKQWDYKLALATPSIKHKQTDSVENQIAFVKQHSPSLMQINSLISITENQITLQRQNTKDNIDLKFFVGNKTSSGDTLPSGNVSNSDVVAGIQLEFKQTLDNRADNAALFQAQLERGLQLQNKKQILENLHYDLASLLAESNAVNHSIKAYEKSKIAEYKKLKDAEQRYRSGRIDIDQLLLFENQLSATDLTLNLQKMELQKRLLKLSLLKGSIWKNITLPVFDFTISDLNGDEDIIGEAL